MQWRVVSYPQCLIQIDAVTSNMISTYQGLDELADDLSGNIVAYKDVFYNAL